MPSSPNTGDTAGGAGALDRLDAMLDRLSQAWERQLERMSSANEKLAQSLDSVGGVMESLGEAVQTTGLAIVKITTTVSLLAGPMRVLRFLGRTLSLTLGTLGRVLIALIAPIGAVVAGLVGLIAVVAVVAVVTRWLIRSSKQIDELAKSARLAGLAIGESFNQRLIGQLSGVGDEVNSIRRQYIGLIRFGSDWQYPGWRSTGTAGT